MNKDLSPRVSINYNVLAVVSVSVATTISLAFGGGLLWSKMSKMWTVEAEHISETVREEVHEDKGAKYYGLSREQIEQIAEMTDD